MHAHFFLRGIKQDVDLYIKFLETRTMMLPFMEKNGKKMVQPIQGQLRYSIFGTWEYIFPENEKDAVLTTLGFHKPLHPNSKKFKAAMNFLRMAMGLKKPPEFKTDKLMVMPQGLYVSVIPIGVKYDKIETFNKGTDQEVTHEAL